MKAFAPGKLVLTGAYAVLEGAPAIAVAVSRGATADTSRVALTATQEVRVALDAEQPNAPAPHADASAMFVGARKLGLGASAAILVASLAARDAEAGADLTDRGYREKLFARARAAHAAAQNGGSGVDVASSVHGGVIEYIVGAPVRAVTLPSALQIAVFACGTSARTSELRAEIERFARVNPAGHRTCMNDLSAIARDAAGAVAASDAAAFVHALRLTARALARLGEGAGIGIVPPGFDVLEALAEERGASFSVAGAGGGDVAIHVGPEQPTAAFRHRAHQLGLFPLDLTLDSKGARVVESARSVATTSRSSRST